MKKFHDVIQDEAGNIVVGAELYVRNNTTPFALVTLYSDNGVTTTANPVVSGTDGYCTFWTADNTLKLEVYVDGEEERVITDFQHFDDLDPEITAIRSMTSAANKLPLFTGSGTGTAIDCTPFAQTLIDDTTAAAARATLEIETDTDGTLAANSDTRIATQRATKTYVDAAATTGLSWKQAVRVGTVAAGTLASDFENGDTVDGVVLATGDRILIKNQAAAAENGIYVVAASGAPTRATDADTGAEFVGAAVLVTAGTLAGTQWSCTNTTAPTIGVTAITWENIGNAAGLLQAINNLDDVQSASTSRTNLQVAYATSNEIDTGTEALKVMSPDAFAGSNRGKIVASLLVSDPNGSAITTGDGKLYWRVPSTCNGMNLVGVAAAVTTASSSGVPTVQVHNLTQTADMLSTRITIDANETDSSTAAAAAVIDAGNDDVATGDQIRIDVDVAGTGTKGLIVELQFQTP